MLDVEPPRAVCGKLLRRRGLATIAAGPPAVRSTSLRAPPSRRTANVLWELYVFPVTFRFAVYARALSKIHPGIAFGAQILVSFGRLKGSDGARPGFRLESAAPAPT
jgi:hypothetical protein